MDIVSEHGQAVAASTRSLLQRLLLICENRLQLLMVEAQEERQRVLLAAALAIGIAVFSLLAGVALTAIIAVLLWEQSPIIALLVMTILYLAVAAVLYLWLNRLFRNWRSFAATLDQLRKDRDCLHKSFP
jgi:uncharacterized membrane protein YqjE